ncbi:response regulator [Desulfovibrio sp. TomC]|uniref:response regulator n=1 Tax=Desulfovibrio sp. TomC TaxID=1562888 RepID=UPI00057425FA|nr:response regulator [Desulfovibrio sp. TomC]KHK03060.1 response regulator [Desulfovibrio sp. TomC]
MTPDQPVVLVLDDEELLRESLSLFLENEGFIVFQAVSAENALALLPGLSCQAVVVDIRLPGLSGLQFIEKAHGLWPRLKFLIYTGSPGVFLSPEVLAAGVTPDFLFTKPAADLSYLAQALRRLLAVP